MPTLPIRAYALLSIAAALLTIGLKSGAYLSTNSVGLLSDAAESVVNLIAALAVFWAITYAALPPDAEHPYGHSKAEYFSSGLESALILVAAVSIAWAALDRLQQPQPLAELGLGLGLSVVASLINGGVGWVLWRAGQQLRSVTLQADAVHLFTDVWTSVGVILGLFLVQLTGWVVLDPLIALGVAANIAWAGFQMLQKTLSALLDRALPDNEQKLIIDTLRTYRERGVEFHALRTRTAGVRRFVSFHLLVPGAWTIQQGHDLSEEIEAAIVAVLPNTMITTHLEPLEDPASWADLGLDRVNRVS
ncbi:cation diffusion facilitator family transporter [Candidatus Cyanaurora vandensis]|uniref:cation diffusion facilitator family transporter n=1 Tax=Candidatus Cyanaurora vandensis TaxID=2714958 RepID=UPI00257ED8E9|nr:cation diffusion facilitator family transporter [Candidatus Cyanaurora vandensis]